MDLLSHKPLFDRFLARGPRPLSCYHFSALFAWQDFFEFEFEIIDDRLCVFAHQPGGCFMYLPPLGGPVQASTLQRCFKHMGRTKIARIENFSENPLPLVLPHDYNVFLKSSEYLYQRKDLERLEGGAYKPKRHDVHVFLKKHPQAQFGPYQPSDNESCARLYQHWWQSRKANGDEIYGAMLEDNERAHQRLLAHSEDLNLEVRVVKVDGETVGYTAGYALNEQTFCVNLEITDLDQKGLAAYIFQSFCGDQAVIPFERVNTMDDFGLPKLTAAKESYRPITHLPMYTLRENR